MVPFISDAGRVVVGNDDPHHGQTSVPWNCHFCGATVMLRQTQDAAKHMTKCPNNPYK